MVDKLLVLNVVKVVVDKLLVLSVVKVVVDKLLVLSVENLTRNVYCRKLKYLKGARTMETLSSFSMFTANKKVIKVITIRKDSKIIVLKQRIYHATIMHILGSL